MTANPMIAQLALRGRDQIAWRIANFALRHIATARYSELIDAAIRYGLRAAAEDDWEAKMGEWERERYSEAFERLCRIAGLALERVQVADDASGAAAEAEHLLSQVITLSGEYIPPRRKSAG